MLVADEVDHRSRPASNAGCTTQECLGSGVPVTPQEAVRVLDWLMFESSRARTQELVTAQLIASFSKPQHDQSYNPGYGQTYGRGHHKRKSWLGGPNRAG